MKMKHRLAVLLASESIATAATKIIDIDESTPISRIVLRTKGTNSSSTPTAHPARAITKIEIVDGSDVLYSLSGVQAAGLNFIEEGELPFTIQEYENDIECCMTCHINFGRYLWDREFALDPRKFKNLQLKITHNKALGGSAPDAGTLYVVAYVFGEGAPTPSKFLMSKEHYSYTLTASGHEYIELPYDYPYRILALQSYVDAYGISTQVGSVKWTLDNDRIIPINGITASELLKLHGDKLKCTQDLAGLGTGSAVYYYITSTYENYLTGVGRSAANAGIIMAQPSGNRVYITSDSSESFVARETGFAPFGYLPLTFGSLLDPADWFVPSAYKSVKLDITAGSGGSGAIAVVIQQARTY